MSNHNDNSTGNDDNAVPYLSTTPSATPPGSPRDDPVFDFNIFEYSPSRPEYIFDGDWQDFCNFDLCNDEGDAKLSMPLPSATANVAALVESNPPHSSVTYDPSCIVDPMQLEGFWEWYMEELRQGSFDSLDFSSAALAGSSILDGCIDPALLGHPVLKDTTGPDDGPDDGSDSSVVSPAFVGFSVHNLDPACDDINDINAMMAQDSDGSDASQADTESSDDGEEDDDADYLEPEDIVRHYWHGGNLKYTFTFDGRRYFMTAEEMLDHFGSVRYSLWHYWKAKKAGRIPYWRIIEYLKRHGHHGLLREMMWHLLPRWLQRLLYAARKDGTLETFVIPDFEPRTPNKKRK
ncbi:hypothetical protein QFC20_007625 [Naganishia adeliensis]|uniref:Uncharacterized protein n=1 Tax=Naganishia adeliensis TaxID=92952 RepID=A0ACC2UXV1_9TREE|nr:hypothetical protein QFC20_007625 [Naganishia adeliensis]